MRKKSKLTKALIAVSFLVGIIAIVTPVLAAGSNRVLFMAVGDDLDINATNLIVGKIDFGEGPPSVKAVFHQRIYDESGEKVYTMMGMLKDGYLINTSYYFLCPLFGFWFINVSQVVGVGVFKTSDTEFSVIFRTLFPIILPNTEGKYVSAPILMFLSPTAEYCLKDPGKYTPGTPENPIDILEQGPWALAAVIWEVDTPMGKMELPVGPISSLTKYIEN